MVYECYNLIDQGGPLYVQEVVKINEAFFNLPEDKKKRILNSALKEFAENGYEQASTNQIVKQANIGKGMLFYYFNNKKELYQYLIEYSIEITIRNYLNQLDSKEPDFIERLMQASRIKFEAYIEHPEVFSFLGSILLNHELELPSHLKERMDELQALGFQKLYDNVDTSLFQDDIDINKLYQLIRWSIEGFQNDLMNRLKGRKLTSIDFEPYFEEFYDYIKILKKSFYK